MSPPPYQVTPADRAPLPASYRTEHRHLGYDTAERERPFAHHYRRRLAPLPAHVAEALAAGPAPARDGCEIDAAAGVLAAPGYGALETGWTRTERGTLVVACRTDMPRVTAAMWDWWFGWHSTDSARYKLWHPAAHQYCAIGEDRSADRSLTDRQRYIDNVSYVDEYVGPRLQRLAIRFFDPARLGIAERPGVTHICARVGISQLPVAAGYIVHQVRPTADGSEMRSRFFLGHGQVLDVPAQAASMPAVARTLTGPLGAALSPLVVLGAKLAVRDPFGRDLLEHCATEMNHLAAFLPELYTEFHDAP